MKAILEFNLPEDQEEFTNANRGGDWKHAMWLMDQWLRSQTKYALDTDSEERVKALYEARDKLHEILDDVTLILN